VRAPWRTTRSLRRVSECAAKAGAAVLGLALLVANASAQISGSASVVSDYRLRGISLSNNEPAAQVGLAYDAAGGWYAGVFASTVEFVISSGRELQTVPFAGYAWRTANGLTWEAGADYAFFTGRARNYDYPEMYVGVASENISGRLYYSPRYFGQSSDAFYLEGNGTHPLTDRVRLLAHLGILRSGGGTSNYGWPEHMVDGRIGVALDWDRFNVQLSWVGTSAPSAAYTITGVRSRNGPLLTVSFLF
jgi:uncharacterized protein (TIGR02001 family)